MHGQQILESSPSTHGSKPHYYSTIMHPSIMGTKHIHAHNVKSGEHDGLTTPQSGKSGGGEVNGGARQCPTKGTTGAVHG
jgi:hypothetical protein